MAVDKSQIHLAAGVDCGITDSRRGIFFKCIDITPLLIHVCRGTGVAGKKKGGKFGYLF